MDYYVDWNCHLSAGMREIISDPHETVETMRLLSDRFAMTRFCMMPDYDCTREPVSVFLIRRFRSQKLLEPLIPKNLKVKFAARALMAPELHKTEHLEKLLLTKDGYLPIRLPIAEYADWMDFEINRLLYRKSFKLIFTSFELYPILYPKEIIKKLLSIDGAIYQFGFKSLTEASVLEIISSLLHQNKTVLLGSSLDCLERAYQFDFEYYTKSATAVLSVADYQTMIRKNRYFWRK